MYFLTYLHRYAKEAGVQFLSSQTTLVYPNYKHPTVVKFFGADKLKTESFRISVKDHKQVRLKATLSCTVLKRVKEEESAPGDSHRRD